MANEKTKAANEISNVRDFTSYRIQRLLDEAGTVEEVLIYAEILYGYENESWDIEWIGGCPIPTGTNIQFWDKDLNPIME